MEEYFVHTATGEKYGPASADTLSQWASEGRIPPGTQVEDAKTGTRMPVVNVPGFISTQPMAMSSVPPTSRIESGQWQNPMAHIGYQKVENNLVKAILTTFFCFTPFGIVAIVYAAQVDGLALKGDIAGARNSAAKANTWANWSIGMVLGVFAIYLVIFAVIGIISATSGHVR